MLQTGHSIKICNKCKLELQFNQFSRSGNGLKARCKLCDKAYCDANREKVTASKQRWADANTEKIKERLQRKKHEYALKAKEYLNNNPDAKKRSAEYKKKWAQENKEKTRLSKKKYKQNPENKLANTLRNRLGLALKNSQKTGSAVRDLGCSIEELKKYLESKFQPGMTWENRGINGWHIDHIIPLITFNLNNKEELKKAVHYTNLQPLWAKQNLSKGKKIT